MGGMFANATNFNQDISNWIITGVTSLSGFMDGKSDLNYNYQYYDNILTSWSQQQLKTGVQLGMGGVKFSCVNYDYKIGLLSDYAWSISDGGCNPPYPPTTFISTWNVELNFEYVITLPLIPSGNYDFIVDWGDGYFDHITSYDQYETTHYYPFNTINTIYISGTIEGWSFNNSYYSAPNLISVEQWGNLKLGDEGNNFYGCYNLVLTGVTDTLNLSGTTNLSNMFTDCDSLTTINNIENWYVGDVTNMSYLFYNQSNFNQDISNWDVSNVIDMSYMFRNATNFNQPIGKWDVGNAQDMSYMFNNATSFNQPLSGWNVSNVTNMSNMFFESDSFNQDLGNWSVNNVTDMSNILFFTSLNTENYDSLLTGWTGWIGGSPTKSVQFNVPFSVGPVFYTTGGTAESARNYLLSPKNWFIGDAGPINNDAFVSVWNTSYGDGLSKITLPLKSTGTYNFTVSWGDGTTDTITTYNQPQVTHNYSSGGPKVIRINGLINGWSFNNGGDKSKLRWITQWGCLSLGNDGGYFYGCNNLKLHKVTDILNLSGTTNLYNMFASCSSLTTVNNINSWDVSNVTNMSGLFYGVPFNQDISNWNVSGVTNMSGLFYSTPFNQNISNWDVSSVTNMNAMFRNSQFNQPLSGWNVSNVTDMSYMFYGATNFNQHLSEWNVSGVTNMSGLFAGSPFNQPISNWNVGNVIYMNDTFRGSQFNQPLSGWNVSKVQYMVGMFAYASNFNQDIGNWNVSGVTNMYYMFQSTKFNNGGSPSINNWDVGNVIFMNYMFDDATSFNQPLSGWNVSKVISMGNMFSGKFNNPIKPIFNQDIGNWNVSGVTYMGEMFIYSFNFNNGGSPSINNWDVGNVQSMSRMFQSAKSFNQPIGNWNVSKVINMYIMLGDATNFNQDLGNWNVSGVTNMDQMLAYTSLSRTNYDSILTGWLGWSGGTPTKSVKSNVPFSVGTTKYSSGTTANDARNYLITTKNWSIVDGGGVLPPTTFVSTWNTTYGDGNPTITLPLVSSGNYNFTVNWGDGSSDVITSHTATTKTHIYSSGGTKTIYINGTISGWSFNNGGDKLKIRTIKQWGSLKLGNNGNYFYGCTYLNLSTVTDTLNLSGTTNLTGMFAGCSSLSSVNNINSWDVSNVTSMEGMFQNTPFNQPLSGWNVGNVNNMRAMFFEATNFNQDLSNWNVGNVIDMSLMFYVSISFNNGGSPNINNWNVSGVTSMDAMFVNSNFNQPIGNWNVSNVGNMSGMFLQASNFNQDLSNWDVSNVGDMSLMFYFSNFNNGGSPNINNWNVSNVADMSIMFQLTPFNQPLSGWNVSNVNNMNGMFTSASNFNQPIGNWNVSNVGDMGGMFFAAINFNQDLGNWNVSNVGDMGGMFQNTSLSRANYDSILTGWLGWSGGTPTKSVQSNVTFGAGTTKYTIGTDANDVRNYLTSTKTWTITDGGGELPITTFVSNWFI